MSEPDDKQTSDDASARARSEIQRLRTKYHRVLRDTLRLSLKNNVDNSRDHITEQMVDLVRTTFDRQMEDFAQIELQLAMSISQRLSAFYLNILGDKHERLLKMHAAMESANENVASRSDRLHTIEWQEKRLDLLLALVAIIVPIVFEFLPGLKALPRVEYALPIGFAAVVSILTGLKFILFRARKSEAGALRAFVAQKEELVSSLVEESAAVPRKDEEMPLSS